MRNLLSLLMLMLCISSSIQGCNQTIITPVQDNLAYPLIAPDIDLALVINGEEVIDVIFDLAFIASDIAWIATTGTGWGALTLDFGCLLVPGITGVGQGYRATKAMSHVVDVKRMAQTTQAINKVTAVGGRIAWTSKQLNYYARHSLSKHSAKLAHTSKDLGQGIFHGIETQTQMRKLLSEVIRRMQQGHFKQRATAKGGKHVYECVVDMGRIVGSTKGKSNNYVRLVMAPNGKGSMYPIRTFQFGKMHVLQTLSTMQTIKIRKP